MERIAVILGKMNNTGVETVVLDYYNNLDRSAYQYDFYIDQNSKGIPQVEITGLGGKVFFLPSVKKFVCYQKTLRKYLEAGNYDVMHVHTNTLAVFALRAGKQAKVPVRILHNHTTSSRREVIRHFIKLILRPFCVAYATDYVACSKHASKWMYGKKKSNSENVKILYNAIDVNRFSFNNQLRLEIRKDLGVSNNFVIGCVARFEKQKNHAFLIDVFSQCVLVNENFRLVLIGEGSLENSIKDKINKLGLADKVIILPQTTKVHKYYPAFDCLVMPSIYEGLGRVVIEAQASGLNIICSNHVPKEVDMGENLVKFLPLRNKKEWVTYLLSIFRNYEFDNLESKRGFAYNCLAKNGYDIKLAGRELNEYYNRFIVDSEVAVTSLEYEKTPLISVLIPVYNVSTYVKDALDSVINQSYKNIEIIIVDDGSTDNSGEICDEYLVDKRVKVFHRENAGLASSRNFLVSQANGEFVVFVDGDDVVSPYYVENLYNAMYYTKADMSCCDFEKFIEGDNYPYAEKNSLAVIFDVEQYIRKVLLQKLECNAWGKLYKTDTIKGVQYPDGALYEDVAGLPSILEKIKTVAFANGKDYYYRQNQKSILHKPFTKKDLDCDRFMNNLRVFIEDNYPNLKKEMDTRYFSAICNLFLRVDKKQFREEYDYLWNKIKVLRKSVLKVKGARIKNKLGAILSYFGRFIFRTAYRLI